MSINCSICFSQKKLSFQVEKPFNAIFLPSKKICLTNQAEAETFHKRQWLTKMLNWGTSFMHQCHVDCFTFG